MISSNLNYFSCSSFLLHILAACNGKTQIKFSGDEMGMRKQICQCTIGAGLTRNHRSVVAYFRSISDRFGSGESVSLCRNSAKQVFCVSFGNGDVLFATYREAGEIHFRPFMHNLRSHSQVLREKSIAVINNNIMRCLE